MSRILPLALSLLVAGVAFADPPKKGPYKPDNSIISDLVDSPEKYESRVLTLRLKFIGGPGDSLKTRVGQDGAPFTAVDPANGAKLTLALDIPRGLQVPAAKDGEEVVATFKSTKVKCGINRGVAVEIRRPGKEDVELKGVKP